MATKTQPKGRTSKAITQAVVDVKYKKELAVIVSGIGRYEEIVERMEKKGSDARLERVFVAILKRRATRVQLDGRKSLDADNLDIEYAILNKLRAAWDLGAPDREAAFYACVSSSALSRYLQANPELVEYRDDIRVNPEFKARKKVVEDLDKDTAVAFAYLRAKLPREFTSGRTGALDAPPAEDETSDASVREAWALL